jgi:hypothetical protein
MRLQLGDWIVRGRIDRAEVVESQLYVRDYKSSLAIPSQEAYETDFQSQFYALICAEGVVDEEGGQPIAKGLDGFHRIQEFPRWRSEEGPLISRYAYSDAGQLYDFKQTVISHLATLEHGLNAGEWQATPGSHCETCPAIRECPIPDDLRDVRTIATDGEAAEVAERVHFIDSESRGLKKGLRKWADDNGPVPAGSDLIFDFRLEESDRVIDKDELRAFIEEHGRQFSDFYKHTTSTKFEKRKVKADD